MWSISHFTLATLHVLNSSISNVPCSEWPLDLDRATVEGENDQRSRFGAGVGEDSEHSCGHVEGEVPGDTEEEVSKDS